MSAVVTPPDLIAEVRSRVNKRNKSAGDRYEVSVAKKMTRYCFGLTKWQECFVRTRSSSTGSVYAENEDGSQGERIAGGQTMGDLLPIKQMARLWVQNGWLGPIECKYREDWSLTHLYTRPATCKIYEYWKKSNQDTNSEHTILCFSKPLAPDFVFHRAEMGMFAPYTLMQIEGRLFVVETLTNFLIAAFPQFAAHAVHLEPQPVLQPSA